VKPAVVPLDVSSAPTPVAVSRRTADFVTLTKPRLNLLVLMTTLGGLYLAAPDGVPLDLLFHTFVGTALVAGGAAALNQVWERKTDRLMRRTAARPLPDGRLGVAEGTWFGVTLSAIGLVELALAVNATAAWVAAVTLISYVLMYTPLKTRTSLATLVGAIPGALPPVIGWTAATGSITLPAIVLFGIVFFWQMPHFLALAWMYRVDYARAGIQMLPAVETDGRHGLPAGTLVVAPTVKYLERAYDAAKYGEISTAPYLEVTSNGVVVSIHFQFAPYALRHASWDDAGNVVQQCAIDTLAQYAPAFKSSIKRVHTITPRDLESTYALSEGDLNHGQLILDQMFFMRPLPGWSNHKTPIDGLYLCGSGVHGGGGISGASGRNAASIVQQRK
jgi:protoheme IX farnesyltransferase